MRLAALLAIFLSLLTACSTSRIENLDLKAYFDEFNVNGCFVLYDLKKDKYKIYNQKRAKTRFYPASTFKIFNTLAALETGAAKDANYFLKWDGIEREYPPHNQDHTLKQAFKNSTLWYYQEMARRIGFEKMQDLVNKVGYGNKNINGRIDQFWLKGDLEIAPLEQIKFLKKLYLNKLPFSQRTIELTKEIMIQEQNESSILRAKTGTTSMDNKQIAWYVGYIEKSDNAYIFALNLESPKPKNFMDGLALKARMPLFNKVLDEVQNGVLGET